MQSLLWSFASLNTEKTSNFQKQRLLPEKWSRDVAGLPLIGSSGLISNYSSHVDVTWDTEPHMQLCLLVCQYVNDMHPTDRNTACYCGLYCKGLLVDIKNREMFHKCSPLTIYLLSCWPSTECLSCLFLFRCFHLVPSHPFSSLSDVCSWLFVSFPSVTFSLPSHSLCLRLVAWKSIGWLCEFVMTSEFLWLYFKSSIHSHVYLHNLSLTSPVLIWFCMARHLLSPSVPSNDKNIIFMSFLSFFSRLPKATSSCLMCWVEEMKSTSMSLSIQSECKTH